MYFIIRASSRQGKRRRVRMVETLYGIGYRFKEV
jgi:hypothetical protein